MLCLSESCPIVQRRLLNPKKRASNFWTSGIAGALRINPGKDGDEIGDEGRDVALEENIVVQQNILPSNICVITLYNR